MGRGARPRRRPRSACGRARSSTITRCLSISSLTIREGLWDRLVSEMRSKKKRLLDGIYVIRTSEPAERLTAADGVRSYKRLGLVEQAFRCLKGIDLLVRPIHHRTADRVRGAHPAVPAGVLRGVAPAARRGNRCCSRTRNWPRTGCVATRCGRPAPRSRRDKRRRRTRRPAACRSRAFARCWPIWARGAETRVWSPATQPDDVPPGDGGRCAAGRGDAVDQDVARNGKSHLTKSFACMEFPGFTLWNFGLTNKSLHGSRSGHERGNRGSFFQDPKIRFSSACALSER